MLVNLKRFKVKSDKKIDNLFTLMVEDYDHELVKYGKTEEDVLNYFYLFYLNGWNIEIDYEKVEPVGYIAEDAHGNKHTFCHLSPQPLKTKQYQESINRAQYPHIKAIIVRSNNIHFGEYGFESCVFRAKFHFNSHGSIYGFEIA